MVEYFVGLRVIIPVCWEEKAFVSPIFTVPEKDGSVRLILNLKIFNKLVKYRHFKMDTLDLAILLMTKGCFMASVDLKHAYYSVPIHEKDQRFLLFANSGQLFQVTCLPMGLSAPRNFTEIGKPVYSALHERGHSVIRYIDMFLQSTCSSFEEC